MTEKNKQTMVSVCMVSYNHVNYIARSIESVLIQKTTFPIQLVIGEDCSNDGTADIVKYYANKYPDTIKARCNFQNMGMSSNFIKTLKECSGKYIAVLDGDDYWTDPFKLQKQVDFLESNPRYSLCCHRYSIYNTYDSSYSKDYCADLFTDDIPGINIDLDLYFKCWITKALTVVFRANCFDATIALRYKYFRDVHLFLHVLQNGKGYCFNFDGGVYIKHADSVHSTISLMERNKVAYLIFKELYEINKLKILKDEYTKHLSVYIDLCFSEKKNYINIFALWNEPFLHKMIAKKIINKLSKIVATCCTVF